MTLSSCRMKSPHIQTEKTSMSHTHLTTTERVIMETYLELRMSIRSIARRTLSYVTECAQRGYKNAKTNCDTTARSRWGRTNRYKELSGHERIQASLSVPMYFADTYSSWQWGSKRTLPRVLPDRNGLREGHG